MEKDITLTLKSLKTYLLQYSHNVDLVDDIMQETVLKALSYGKILHENIGWLCITAKRSLFKKQKHKHFYESCFVDNKDKIEEEKSAVEYMHLLEHGARNLLYMKYFNKSSIQELSTVFKKPEGTIKRQLFEARKKLKKEIAMSEKMLPPEILVTSNKNPFQKKVKITGQSLLMGNPAMPIGFKEKVHMYMYPGKVFSYETQTESTRTMDLMGKEVVEIVNKHKQFSGENQRRMYYTVTENTLTMVMRIFERNNGIEVQTDPNELVDPTPRVLEVGTQNYENHIEEICIVNVHINDHHYDNAFQVKRASSGYHGKELNIDYYSSKGQPILQQSFIGDDWKMGGYVSWEKVKDSYEIEFADNSYRLWIEIVLMDSHN
jgi:RNA polymerase sigma-70 factor (ECF subfamily)